MSSAIIFAHNCIPEWIGDWQIKLADRSVLQIMTIEPSTNRKLGVEAHHSFPPTLTSLILQSLPSIFLIMGRRWNVVDRRVWCHCGGRRNSRPGGSSLPTLEPAFNVLALEASDRHLEDPRISISALYLSLYCFRSHQSGKTGIQINQT